MNSSLVASGEPLNALYMSQVSACFQTQVCVLLHYAIYSFIHSVYIKYVFITLKGYAHTDEHLKLPET